MPNLTFFGAAIHGFSFSPAPKRGEGGPVVLIDASITWNDKIRGWGGWEDVPETVGGTIHLIPKEIAIQGFEMTPGKGLENQAFELGATEISDCQLFIPTKEDQERELRFTIKTQDKGAETILGKYGRCAGGAVGKIKIIYQEGGGTQVDLTPDAQEELPLKGDAIEGHNARTVGRKKDVQ